MSYARDPSTAFAKAPFSAPDIPPLAPADLARARQRVDGLAKPLGSLGRLEDIAVHLAAIQKQERLCLDPACLFTVAGDHGVTDEGVNSVPKAVTRIQSANFLNGRGGISAMCKTTGIGHYMVDAGVAGEDFPAHPKLIRHKIRPGTANIALGPAMSLEDCDEALALGLALAHKAAHEGCRVVAVGEMGIGNTTPSAALFCALLGLSPEEAVGPGAGVPAIGLPGKIQVVRRALEANANAVESGDARTVLAALGGFEIAAMTGIMLGAAHAKMPVILDGYISAASYAVALRMAPNLADYVFCGHASAEPGHAKAASLLGLAPLLDLGLRLGEGTGAALAYGLLKAAANMYNDMASLDELGIDL